MLKRNAQLLLTLLRLADLLAVLGAWAVAYAARLLAEQWHLSRYAIPSLKEFTTYIVVSVLLAPLVYDRMGLYIAKRTVSLMREMVRVLQVVLVVWALTYVIVGLINQKPVSRITMLAALLAWMTLASLSRIIGRIILRHMRSRGMNLRQAAIVGTGRLGQKLHSALAHNPWTGITPVYFIDDHKENKKLRHLPVYGPVEDAARILSDYPVDIVFVALSKVSHERIEEVVNLVTSHPVDVRVVPNLLSVQLFSSEVTQLDNLAIISLTDNPQQRWSNFPKNLFDRLGALVALCLLSPFMLLIAMVIKFSDGGPVFYRQVRASLGGRPFSMLKFRTMGVNAEQATGPVWTVPNDPRVTRFGRWLRRTSLDELPQLINVLSGDMSLVGPRPERPELIGQFKDRIPRYMLRHHVKAGITGWAQIHGMRGYTSLQKRIQYDLFYIKNWSFALDLWILIVTPFRGLVHANAY